MKITDAEVIRNGEKELIDSLTGDLDWSIIEKIFKERHKLKLGDEVEYKGGNLVVHENQIAYQLAFDVKVTLNVVFDRNGDYLELETDDPDEAESDEVDGIDQPDMEIERVEEDVIAVNELPDATDVSDVLNTDTDIKRSDETADSVNRVALDEQENMDVEEDIDSIFTSAEEIKDDPNDTVSRMASEIAEMLTDINDE